MVEVVACAATHYEMVAVGVDLHVKLLTFLHESLSVFSTVAEVDVVVSCTMYEEQLTVKFRGTADRVFCISWILFRRAHVAFRVDRVVVFPVCGCCYSHSGFEHGAPFRHGHQRVEATE